MLDLRCEMDTGRVFLQQLTSEFHHDVWTVYFGAKPSCRLRTSVRPWVSSSWAALRHASGHIDSLRILWEKTPAVRGLRALKTALQLLRRPPLTVGHVACNLHSVFSCIVCAVCDKPNLVLVPSWLSSLNLSDALHCTLQVSHVVNTLQVLSCLAMDTGQEDTADCGRLQDLPTAAVSNSHSNSHLTGPQPQQTHEGTHIHQACLV